MTNTTTQLALRFIEIPIIPTTIEASTTSSTKTSKFIESTTTKNSSTKKIIETKKIALNKSRKAIFGKIIRPFLVSVNLALSC